MAKYREFLVFGSCLFLIYTANILETSPMYSELYRVNTEVKREHIIYDAANAYM